MNPSHVARAQKGDPPRLDNGVDSAGTRPGGMPVAAKLIIVLVGLSAIGVAVVYFIGSALAIGMGSTGY